jgi:DNA polymerase/3'-5' exonuclease PolX
MSSGEKRPLGQCIIDADAFMLLFAGHFEQWAVAGSVRRQKPEVGDIEHVVVPKPSMLDRMDSLLPGSLFGGEDRPLAKAIKSDGRTRWGQKYRAVTFRGFTHEVFFAEPGNFGAVLAIRTGPAEFSKQCVTRALSRGMEQREGWLRYRNGDRIQTPDEETWFKMLGMQCIPPEERGLDHA